MKIFFIFLSLILFTSEQGLNQDYPVQNQNNYNQRNENLKYNSQMTGNVGKNINNPHGRNQLNENNQQNSPNMIFGKKRDNNYVQDIPQNINNGQNKNIQILNKQTHQYSQRLNQQQISQNQQQYPQHRLYQNTQQYPQQQQNQNIKINRNYFYRRNNYFGSKVEEIYLPNIIPFPQNFISINEQKRQNLSLHYEDCNNVDIFCIKGLKCKLNRCFTNLELSEIKNLGLEDKNVCEDFEDCPVEQECIKHRCVNYEEDVDINKRNEDYDPSINLLFSGGIFLNGKAYESGYNPDNTFNYDHFFQYITNDIKKADLAIIAQETIFETDKRYFFKNEANTPTELGDAIVKAGFKLVLHGSLYAFAKEERGILNTINFWKNKYPYIKILGISEDERSSNDDYYIFSKNGIKIGLVNFYGHSKKIIPENKQFYLNMMKKGKVKNLIEKLSSETDFVIVCVNWGKKNSKRPTENQIQWAKLFTASGAKLIIGYHSSLVQEVSSVKSKGKRALVFWSLGHLINDNSNKYSILSALANITISKSEEETYISDYNLIPVINHKGKGRYYSVYKLSEYSDKLFEISNINHTNFNRQNIVKKCTQIMGGFADCY